MDWDGKKAMLEEYEYDYFRYYGTTKISWKNIIKDYRLLYLYAWRKISSGSRMTLLMKIILKRLKNYHIEIPYSVKIGKGFFMDHAFNITINSKAVLGDNVSMLKGATIGADKKGAPTIGSNVYIGINSTIVGEITIGDDVLIAPNTYVNFDVPAHSVVLGSPGVIHTKEHATEGYLYNSLEKIRQMQER